MKAQNFHRVLQICILTPGVKTPTIFTLYWEAFCFHFAWFFDPQVRKMRRTRAADKEQTGDSVVRRVGEPGKTSLIRRWALSQPSCADKTHSTKQGQHCSPAASPHPNSKRLSRWRNGAMDNSTSCDLRATPRGVDLKWPPNTVRLYIFADHMFMYCVENGVTQCWKSKLKSWQWCVPG